MADVDPVASGLVEANRIERFARAERQNQSADPEDRRHAEIVLRQALGLRRAFEKWVADRAQRALVG